MTDMREIDPSKLLDTLPASRSDVRSIAAQLPAMLATLPADAGEVVLVEIEFDEREGSTLLVQTWKDGLRISWSIYPDGDGVRRLEEVGIGRVPARQGKSTYRREEKR